VGYCHSSASPTFEAKSRQIKGGVALPCRSIPYQLFTHAITRAPASNFAHGLTTVDLGAPDYERALVQYAAYCAALEMCGLTLTRLQPDERYPDSTFVEDTAVLTSRVAILSRPGAPSREEEVAAMASTIASFCSDVRKIEAPGTLDGGDVCETGEHFFIGISRRTNKSGARQLGAILTKFGYTFDLIDIRTLNTILHLKSGIASLAERRLVVIDELADRSEFHDFELIRIPTREAYSANCVQVNNRVLVATGFPKTEAHLRGLGYDTLLLEMSEFEKMDGGLSCLSLRF
jgi:dimethylargininase